MALEDNGGEASASYNDGDASIVNDGNTADQPFWAGNIETDRVTVTFNQVYALQEVEIFTNQTNNYDTQLQLSKDGQAFTDIGYVVGSPSCDELKMGNGRILCRFEEARDASDVRVVITSDNPGSVRIQEIEARGK